MAMQSDGFAVDRVRCASQQKQRPQPGCNRLHLCRSWARAQGRKEQKEGQRQRECCCHCQGCSIMTSQQSMQICMLQQIQVVL